MKDYTYTLSTAPAWMRLIAQLLDIILVFFVVAIFMLAFPIPGQLFKWIFLWTYLGYSILMDAYKQGTVGKLYMGLKVIKTSELRSDLLTSFYRNLIKILTAFMLWDAILILLIAGRIGIHNTIAKSTVVLEEIK